MTDRSPLNPRACANASGALTPEAASADVAYRLARRRVRMLRGWHVHALIYGCVIAGLWITYAFSGHAARFHWPLPPTLGWGLGLAIHGIVVWAGASQTGRQWESRKIQQYLNEELLAGSGSRE